MGIYYRSVSKRTVTVQGMVIALTNFWGKAPSILYDGPTAKWDAFCARAVENADRMWDKVDFVTMAVYGDLSKNSEYPIAEWHGQSLLDDRFWDDHAVGTIKVFQGWGEINWKSDYVPYVIECY